MITSISHKVSRLFNVTPICEARPSKAYYYGLNRTNTNSTRSLSAKITKPAPHGGSGKTRPYFKAVKKVSTAVAGVEPGSGVPTRAPVVDGNLKMVVDASHGFHANSYLGMNSALVNNNNILNESHSMFSVNFFQNQYRSVRTKKKPPLTAVSFR